MIEQPRQPFRIIPLAEYHERRADLTNRVYEDELENDLVAKAYALNPFLQGEGQALTFNVYIDDLERHRTHDKGRAGFRLVVFGSNEEALTDSTFDSFAISHTEDPVRERSPMAWEIVGRQLMLRRAGIVRFGFLHHAVQDDELQAFTARSWKTPEDLGPRHH